MNLTVEYQPITELFRNAHTEGRHFLYEFEVYNLLSLSGSETPPKCSFIPRNAKPMEEEIMSLPGEKAVLKIISPKRCSAFAFALLQKRTIRRKCLASPPPNCLNA